MFFGGVSPSSSKQCSFIANPVSPWIEATDFLNLKFKFDETNVRVSAQWCNFYDKNLGHSVTSNTHPVWTTKFHCNSVIYHLI